MNNTIEELKKKFDAYASCKSEWDNKQWIVEKIFPILSEVDRILEVLRMENRLTYMHKENVFKPNGELAHVYERGWWLSALDWYSVCENACPLYDEHAETEPDCNYECPLRVAFAKLADYEDTNLTPAEIEALKAKLQKVERERDAAVQVIYSVPTCTNCIHMDKCDEIGGRCEGRGYGGDCHEPYDEPHFKWRGLEDTTCE